MQPGSASVKGVRGTVEGTKSHWAMPYSALQRPQSGSQGAETWMYLEKIVVLPEVKDLHWVYLLTEYCETPASLLVQLVALLTDVIVNIPAGAVWPLGSKGPKPIGQSGVMHT